MPAPPIKRPTRSGTAVPADVATLTKLIRTVLSGFLDSASDSPGESPRHLYRF